MPHVQSFALLSKHIPQCRVFGGVSNLNNRKDEGRCGGEKGTEQRHEAELHRSSLPENSLETNPGQSKFLILLVYAKAIVTNGAGPEQHQEAERTLPSHLKHGLDPPRHLH